MNTFRDVEVWYPCTATYSHSLIIAVEAGHVILLELLAMVAVEILSNSAAEKGDAFYVIVFFKKLAMKLTARHQFMTSGATIIN